MEINMNGMQEQTRIIKSGGVVVGNVKKTVEMINSNGDVIDPVTKVIITPSKEEKE